MYVSDWVSNWSPMLLYSLKMKLPVFPERLGYPTPPLFWRYKSYYKLNVCAEIHQENGHRSIGKLGSCKAGRIDCKYFISKLMTVNNMSGSCCISFLIEWWNHITLQVYKSLSLCVNKTIMYLTFGTLWCFTGCSWTTGPCGSCNGFVDLVFDLDGIIQNCCFE